MSPAPQAPSSGPGKAAQTALSSGAAAPSPRRSAIPRHSWFRLQNIQPTHEEACRRVHAFASRHPALYRARLRLYLFCMALFHLYAIALMVAVPLAFPWACRESALLAPIYSQPVLRGVFIGFVYASFLPLAALYLAAVFRAFTLAIPAPRGIPASEADAPRLFRLLAETCRSLDIAPIRRVLISPERALEVRRIPKRGLLGPVEPVLVAGLPLLEELSAQQFRAQLAHELSHLATHKRRFGGRVLTLLSRLKEMRAAAEAQAIGRGFWSCQTYEALADMMDGLLRRLGAQTLPAARQHEAEADAIAAAVAGREFAAAALVRRRLASYALSQQFRDECLRQAEVSPRPPAGGFERRAEAARGAFSETQVHAWLRHELEAKDDLVDSHPPLWDRLRMFGYQLENLDDFRALLEATRPHVELGETAARFFLGDTAERSRAEFFSEWEERQAPDWRLRFETYEGLRHTAAEWPAAAEKSSCGPAELWQIAVAIGNTQSWRAARPVAQRILELDPLHGDANLMEGQQRLEDGDGAGLEALERAMQADPAATLPACHLAERFLEAGGDYEAAAKYKARAEERRRAEQAIAQERAHVRPADTLSAPECSGEVAAALLRAVQHNASHIRSAYLFRKRVAGEEKRPLYVLGVERRSFLYQNAALANRLLLRRIGEGKGLPSDILICVITRANRALLEKWKSVPGCLLWSAAAQGTAEQAPMSVLPKPAPFAPHLREASGRRRPPAPQTTAPAK